MQSSSNSLARKNRVLITIGVIALLVGLVFLVLRTQSSANAFSLQTSTPSLGESVSPERSSVVFSFNKELLLKQGGDFAITVTPEVNFIFAVDGSDLLVNLTNVLLDDATYFVSVNNIGSVSGETLPIVSTTFRVVYSSGARKFLDSLPYVSSEFAINRVSEYGVFVLARKNPEDQQYTDALSLMKESGLTPSLFQVGTGSAIIEPPETN